MRNARQGVSLRLSRTSAARAFDQRLEASRLDFAKGALPRQRRIGAVSVSADHVA